MRIRWINALLIITSLLGYLEWGNQHHSFLFQVEKEIILKLFRSPGSVLHPLTILPLIGQFLLLITIFQKTPSKKLTYAGIAGLGSILLFIFLIGIFSGQYKLILSTIPFMLLAFFALRTCSRSAAIHQN